MNQTKNVNNLAMENKIVKWQNNKKMQLWFILICSITY